MCGLSAHRKRDVLHVQQTAHTYIADNPTHTYTDNKWVLSVALRTPHARPTEMGLDAEYNFSAHSPDTHTKKVHPTKDNLLMYFCSDIFLYFLSQTHRIVFVRRMDGQVVPVHMMRDIRRTVRHVRVCDILARPLVHVSQENSLLFRAHRAHIFCMAMRCVSRVCVHLLISLHREMTNTRARALGDSARKNADNSVCARRIIRSVVFLFVSVSVVAALAFAICSYSWYTYVHMMCVFGFGLLYRHSSRATCRRTTFAFGERVFRASRQRLPATSTQEP